MGLRFRKSIKLAPGIRMNFSGSGISWTLGPRGASINFGKRGTFLSAGIPGTGLYSRERLGSCSRAGPRQTRSYVDVPIKVVVGDDGTVSFLDSDGNPLTDHVIRIARRQQGDAIHGLIQEACDQMNAQVNAMGEIHFHTPRPDVKRQYQVREYGEPSPEEPSPRRLGLVGRLWRAKRERIEEDNAEQKRRYLEALLKWREERSRSEEMEQRRKEMVEMGTCPDLKIMEEFLGETLQSIVWPRETTVSIEICDSGGRVFLDVDLPEIEDMPKKTASVPQRGCRLSVRELSPTQVQRLYMRHIHGIGFRIIGEVFAGLQGVQEVILSAFSQRIDRGTGHTIDEYLYSVRVGREAWCQINFDNLRDLDVVEALTRFDLRRQMTKTGSFKRIEPFAPNL